MRGSGLARDASGGKDHLYNEDSTTLAGMLSLLTSSNFA